MHRFISFPFLRKFLMNAEYMIKIDCYVEIYIDNPQFCM
jgi:hypothetical protein